MGGTVEKRSWEVGLIHTDLTEDGIKFLYHKGEGPMLQFGINPNKGWLRCMQVDIMSNVHVVLELMPATDTSRSSHHSSTSPYDPGKL